MTDEQKAAFTVAERACQYALQRCLQRWQEDGQPGEPTIAFIKQWIPYFLSWSYGGP